MISFTLNLKTKGDMARLGMVGKVSCPRAPEGCRGHGRINAEWFYYGKRSLGAVGKLAPKVIDELRRRLRGSMIGRSWRFGLNCQTCGVNFSLSRTDRKFARATAEDYLNNAVKTRGRAQSFANATPD